jgi:hypothetical protein
LSFVLGCAVLIIYDGLTALLFLAGGILSSISFIWLKGLILKLSFSSKGKTLLPMIGLYFLRLILIIGFFFIIILLFSKKGVAFAAGFSVTIVVFLVEASIAITRSKKWKS